MTLLIFHVCVAAALLTIAIQTLLNLARTPRLVCMPAPVRPPPAAVLIPARNEEANIGACVRRWASQAYPAYEIVVFDDDSSDATTACALAAGAGRVRVIRGGPLPPGWRGKTHACHSLRETTSADLLVFADADVRPAPDTLLRLAGAAEHLGADALSALPSHASASPAVRALAAVQNWAPLAFLPLWLPAARRRPVFAALNGQLVAIRASVYDRSGGFAAVRASLGEDAVLGRRLVESGYAVALVDGTRHLACWPYARLGQLWTANVRNLVVALLGSRLLLLAAATGLATLYLGPPIVLVLGLTLGEGGTAAWTWLPLAEIGLGLLSRALADRSAGYAPWMTLLHPLAVLALVGMGVDSAIRATGRGGVQWRGRRYQVRDAA